MSSSLEAAVRDLTSAVRALSVATESLALLVGTPRPGACNSDYLIEIVQEGYEQFYFEFVECRLARTFQSAESGPPTVPPVLFEFAEEKLQLGEPALSARVTRAFNLGFWASVAIDTHLNFECDEAAPGSVIAHWVILRSSYNYPFRVNSLNDLAKFVDVRDSKIVYQSFETKTEVELFCLGAGKAVPELWRAGNPN